MSVKPIPDGYGGVTPYLYVHDAVAALDFYHRAFGAVETVRMPMPGGRIGHAEMKVGNAMFMLADEMPEMAITGPKTLKGTSASFLIYVADVDSQFAKALAAGAKEKKPLENQFYGDRMGVLEDPFGHHWSLATHVEDVAPEEMKRRMAKQFGPA